MSAQKQGTGDAGKPKKHRSPNFPALNLEKAVGKAKELYEKEKQFAVPLAAAMKDWGLAIGGSVGDQCLAALKAYGLIVVTGTGDGRMVKVSDAAFRIIMESDDRDVLLKQAALAPALHRDVWGKYGGRGLPSDEALKHFLLFEKRFNPASVKDFISQFRATISFARIEAGVTIGSETPGGTACKPLELNDMVVRSVSEGTLYPWQQVPQGQAQSAREFVLPLIGGSAVLRVPHPMGRANFDLLKRVLDAIEAALVGPAEDSGKNPGKSGDPG
ncbi:MAG TPA: hypothetical protein VMS93_03010 [Candidatus Saccharimonadales bacterium]|nr:hypothetical protein [Candidatus Saccharimonadales bacterium]